MEYEECNFLSSMLSTYCINGIQNYASSINNLYSILNYQD